MMKIRKKLRSNGGYALVYAVVAMTLMLAVVAGLTLTSVRGLRTQQAAVESLQKRYEAAGEMEATFANIAKYSGTISASGRDDAKKQFKDGFEREFEINSNDLEDDETNQIFTVKISSSGVDAVLSVSYEVVEDTVKGYVGRVTSVSYESYSYTEATT